MGRAWCLVILCFPLATAQVDGLPAESLVGSDAELAGTAHVEADLAGLVAANSSLAFEAIHLEVRSGALEVDEQRVDVMAVGVGLTPATETSSHDEIRQASVSSFSPHSVNRILLVPIGDRPQLVAALGESTWTSSLDTGLEFAPWGSRTRPPIALDRAGTAVQDQDSGVLVVAAPFRLVVWGADFVITTPEGSQPVSTGEFSDPVGPGVDQRIEREAFLDVLEGNITFPMGMDVDLYVVVRSLRLERGMLTISNPAGKVPVNGQEVPAGSRALRLDAPLATAFESRSGLLEFRFPTPPSKAHLDGVAVRVEGGGSSWWIQVGLVVAVLFSIVAIVLAEWKHRQRLRALDHQMRGKLLVPALGLAQSIRRWRPRNPDAIVAETIALIHAERFDAALVLLESGSWTASLDAFRKMLRAMAEAGRGERDQAVESLTTALRDAPHLATEAAAAPLLAGLVEEARRRARQDFAAAGAGSGHS